MAQATREYIRPHQTGDISWINAYKAFLLNRNESKILKIAPLLLIFGSPEIVASNLIPVIGEIADLGGMGLIALVMVRTFMAVRKYR